MYINIKNECSISYLFNYTKTVYNALYLNSIIGIEFNHLNNSLSYIIYLLNSLRNQIQSERRYLLF